MSDEQTADISMLARQELIKGIVGLINDNRRIDDRMVQRNLKLDEIKPEEEERWFYGSKIYFEGKRNYSPKLVASVFSGHMVIVFERKKLGGEAENKKQQNCVPFNAIHEALPNSVKEVDFDDPASGLRNTTLRVKEKRIDFMTYMQSSCIYKIYIPL